MNFWKYIIQWRCFLTIVFIVNTPRRCFPQISLLCAKVTENFVIFITFEGVKIEFTFDLQLFFNSHLLIILALSCMCRKSTWHALTWIGKRTILLWEFFRYYLFTFSWEFGDQLIDGCGLSWRVRKNLKNADWWGNLRF